MTTPSRYVVGIDLGTTNSALAYVDTSVAAESPDEVKVEAFPVDQVVAAGSVEPRPTLPSAVYLAAGGELPEGALNLPWRPEESACVGVFAREQGARVPSRFVHSSKSWLCHGGVDREARILPWEGEDADAKRSPAEVATVVLQHLRENWQARMGCGLDDQDVVLCVPASFDAGARNMTVAAAERAGLKRLTLLEEPQAAFHAWIEGAGRGWRKQVHPGDLVLVVDVGGGTSDFSLIAVQEKEGELELRRVAVGEHILLGGDNMDLALAYSISARLEAEGKKLDAFRFAALVQHCRAGKELLLSDGRKKTYPIALAGRGSGLVAGTIRTELAREGLDEFLLEGFFPACTLEDRPARAPRTGFRQAGLPYATDAAITRHLAKFLGQHQSLLREFLPEARGAILPTAILFNGGVFRSEVLRERIRGVVASWCQAATSAEPRVLAGTDLDLAVARGAAYLGVARRGRGVRIRGGSARSYYVGVESAVPAVPGMKAPLQALCVVPHGMEEGTSVQIGGEPVDLCMWTGEPAVFRFLSSTQRRQDQPGHLVPVNPDEFEEHSPIETILAGEQRGEEGEAVEVDLQSTLSEIGTLDLECVERRGQRRWKLEFNVRHGEG